MWLNTNGSSSHNRFLHGLLWNIFVFHAQKFSLLHVASGKKVLTPTLNTENSPDDSFDYVPPKVSLQRNLFKNVIFRIPCSKCELFCVLLSPQPKGKRFTTAKAPQNTTIYIEQLMSPSEDESEEEEEWRPEKLEKGRRVSKKTKATGVSWSALWSYTGGTKRQKLFSTFLVNLMRRVLTPPGGECEEDTARLYDCSAGSSAAAADLMDPPLH